MPVGVVWSSDFGSERAAAALRFLGVEDGKDDHSFTRFSLREIHLDPFKMPQAVFLWARTSSCPRV